MTNDLVATQEYAPSPFRARSHIRFLIARVKQLEAQLLSIGVETVEAESWIVGMQPQEVFLLEILAEAYPRAVDMYAIEERLPGHDHAADRDVRIVRVRVSTIRRKLGHDVIETIPGVGYRLGMSRDKVSERAALRFGAEGAVGGLAGPSEAFIVGEVPCETTVSRDEATRLRLLLRIVA